MKRRLSMLLALMVMALPIAARAETTLDLSALSLDQLYALREQLNTRIDELEHLSEAHTYESGTYLIGRDIPQGDYVLYENENAVFANAVIRAGKSVDAALMTYHLVYGQAVIRLEAGAWLTLSEVTAIPIAQAKPVLDAEGQTGEGGYLVGALLPAGRYTVSPDSKAPLSSYSVYGDVLGTGAQLLKFEVLHETVEIELMEGEYIELSGCTLTQLS